MNRETALGALRSSSPHERLKAAQFFAKNYSPTDIPVLREARNRESVAYVKKRLDAAITRATNSATSIARGPTDEPEISASIQKQVWGKAVQEISGKLLHELEPRIGQIREAAKDEVPNFDSSRIKQHLDHLERIFSGMNDLRQAAATPKIEEFDLALLIKDIITVEAANRDVQVSDQGTKPFVIRSDQRLLTLAVSAGLRNAIEAVESLSEKQERHPIVINWGKTDVDYWIVILDRGPGLVGPASAAFEVGRTTKRGHSGFGLPIVRQAMDSLEGSANLAAGQAGGAKLELRWDQ